MDDVRGYFLGPPHSKTPAALKQIKISSPKSSENIQKREGVPNSTVSNELTMNASDRAYYNFKNPNPKRIKIEQICLEYMSLSLLYFLISQNNFADLKGPNKSKLKTA